MPAEATLNVDARVESLAAVIQRAVRRDVSGFPQPVEQLRGFRAKNRSGPELFEDVRLAVAVLDGDPGVRGRVPGEQLTELAELDERGIRVVEDIPFGESRVPDENRIVLRQEGEVRRVRLT